MKKSENSDVFQPPMPKVPANWQVLPFAKATKTISDRGRKVKKRNYLAEGNIPVIDQGQEFVGGYTNDESVAYDGNLPVILFGDHTRTFKYVDRPFAVGADGVKILQPADGYDPKFFFYLMQSLRIPSRGYSRHFQFLKKFHLPIAPRPEQEGIVSEIEKQFSRLDEAVTNLHRVKANLKRYRAAVLKAAVEGRLVETEAELARREGRAYETGEQLLQRILEARRRQRKGKGKFKKPAAPDTTDLPELPEGWCWASLGSLGEVIGGLTKNPKRSKLRKKLPYLRVANVYADELRLDEIKEIGVEDNELEKLLLQKGDLLIVEGNGSPEQIGRVAIWDGSIAPCVHQNHLIKVRMSTASMSRWALSWLLSPNGRRHVKSVASSTSGLYTLSVCKVSRLPLPIPPSNEQRKITEEIERRLSLDTELEILTDSNFLRVERLRHSILEQSFARTSSDLPFSQNDL